MNILSTSLVATISNANRVTQLSNIRVRLPRRSYSHQAITRKGSNLCLRKQDMESAEPILIKKALVLTKFTRLEFEQRKHPELDPYKLENNLRRRGSDYSNLVNHHNIHSTAKNHVVNTLEKFGVDTKIVDRFGYTQEEIDCADVVFTTGGDGTFLMAAGKIKDRSKLVIGINTDPARSVGHLCLPTPYSINFTKALEKLTNGDFELAYRQRLRIVLESEDAENEPIELHDQQLKYLEYRSFDLDPPATHEVTNDAPDEPNKKKVEQKVLHVRALNEVFVGESLSSRVSYYDMSIDNNPRIKHKSSGLTICTGTGSTSWSFNINKVTPQCVEKLFKIVEDVSPGNLKMPENADNMKGVIKEVTDRFNESLKFSPGEAKMAYTIRDPIVFGTNFNMNPRGFANNIEVRSRMFDACVVVDGSLSYRFNDGALARFEIHEEDALKTVLFE